MRARVQWSDDEEALLVGEVVRRRRDDPRPSLIQLLERAQHKVLPPGRQRPNINWKSCEGLFTRILSAIQQTTPARTVEVPVPVPESIVQVEVPAAVHPEQLLQATSTAFLVATLWTRWAVQWERLLGALAKMPPPEPLVVQQPVRPPVVVPAKPRLPRVAVIGLLKAQFERVQQQLNGHKCELLFVDKDASKGLPTRCDYVICTRHLRHAWTDAAQRQLPQARILWAEGSGDTAVLKCIHDVCSRQ